MQRFPNDTSYHVLEAGGIGIAVEEDAIEGGLGIQREDPSLVKSAADVEAPACKLREEGEFVIIPGDENGRSTAFETLPQKFRSIVLQRRAVATIQLKAMAAALGLF